MPEFDVDAYEQIIQHSLDNPMPHDLRRQIEETIEPVTINRDLDHGEVMDIVAIAYPMIRDYLIQRQS